MLVLLQNQIMAPLKDTVWSQKRALTPQNLTFVKLHFTGFIANGQEREKKTQEETTTQTR